MELKAAGEFGTTQIDTVDTKSQVQKTRLIWRGTLRRLKLVDFLQGDVG